jgi:hypothetical protein
MSYIDISKRIWVDPKDNAGHNHETDANASIVEVKLEDQAVDLTKTDNCDQHQEAMDLSNALPKSTKTQNGSNITTDSKKTYCVSNPLMDIAGHTGFLTFSQKFAL